jgi:hypothetical protein
MVVPVWLRQLNWPIIRSRTNQCGDDLMTTSSSSSIARAGSDLETAADLLALMEKSMPARSLNMDGTGVSANLPNSIRRSCRGAD